MATPNFSENYFLDQMKTANLYYGSSLSEAHIESDILAMVNRETAMQYHILPLSLSGEAVVVVTDTQQTFKQRSQLQHILGRPLKILLAAPENLRLALLEHYGISSLGQTGSYQRHTVEEDMTPLKGRINTMLQAAAREAASDIHILPTSGGVMVHFRVHGHIYDMTQQHGFSVDEATNVTNLIKQMDESGNMDISKTNMPNEGSFFMTHGNESIFVRMETVPVGNEGIWQKINLRLLPQAGAGNRAKRLDDIGYTPDDLAAIKRTLYRNSTGMFINSGPTGAGKTTSLYAQIYYVLEAGGNSLDVVFTIDDPIEIREERFTQVQVRKAGNELISLTDQKILAAALRSDPDIILYNEIRDKEAAIVAMQASTTGHKLFSTVHAADCIRTISRLLDLDVSKTTLLSELKMIISQRFVAKLCPHCSKPHELTAEEKALLSSDEYDLTQDATAHLREIGSPEDVRACSHCNHGITGRTAVAEYVIFNNDIRDALLSQRSFNEIHGTLRKFGYKTMWEKGLQMALKGEIALSELIRAVGKEE